MDRMTTTDIKHYHVTGGGYADDEGVPALSLLGAIHEVTERAGSVSEFKWQEADSFADSEDYRDAWFALRESEDLANLARNVGRFAEYYRDPKSRPVVYQTDEEIESGARFILGLESVKGIWTDLGDIVVDVCFDEIEEIDDELWHKGE